MNFIKKIISFFKRTKDTVSNFELKIQAYVKKHSQEIKLIMSILEALFPPKTGIKKMTCVIKIVGAAIGLENITPQIENYIETELQKQYDKFKEGLTNGKET